MRITQPNWTRSETSPATGDHNVAHKEIDFGKPFK